MINDLTIIIKTFNRYKCLKTLLKSIYKYYPNIKIIIADDSIHPYKNKILKKFKKLNIEYYILPADTGISYGRNFCVKQVKTKYFCLLDDDFVFDNKTNLIAALNILKNKKLDILGGYIRNYRIRKNFTDNLKFTIDTLLNRYSSYNYTGNITINNDSVVFDYQYSILKDYYETDIVLNFFIAKTNKILQKNLWDEELKISEHSAFFYKAKLNNLKIASTNKFSIRHCSIQTSEYMEKRNRNYFKLFMKKYNIKTVKCNYEDPSKNYTVSI